MKTPNTLRTALAIPAMLSGLWFAHAMPSVSVGAGSEGVGRLSSSSGIESAAFTRGPSDAAIQRRLRVEAILTSLDRIASAALTMKPESAERLEPVIVDIAEQTLDLVGTERVSDSNIDRDLDRIEEMVQGLVQTMNRMIEPEMSL